MTSSMLRRQLKNLVQNYSEAEVKVREATSNDPWGPSSTQMADISDLTYNVVACNEIMTMLWKRLKDDKNWRHIHKSLTLLEYLLKTGDDRVLLKMKDNIYIVKALTEYRFVEKDGKDQGVNVREKAKVVLVLMEDDDKLKEEREFAFKTREKTSKGSAASSTDTLKDPNYKPCYVPGATGLPSLDNIPSVADLTASFTARKEERLKQEAEKKETARRAKLSEDELKWEDAGKSGDINVDAWGGQKSEEEEAKPDPWGAPKEPQEATGPWGIPSSPDTSETPAGNDAWGAPTKSEEDPFAAPKNGEDPFAAKSDNEDPFAAPKDQNDAFSTSKGDPFNAPSSDPFSAPKDKEDPFAPDKPDPFSSSNNDPFKAQKEDPFNAPKDDPFSAKPSTRPKEDPFTSSKDDPFNSPKDDPFSAPKDDPFNTPKDDPFSAKASTPPKEDPFTSSKDDPFNTPKDDPFTSAKDDPFSAKASTPPTEDPFNTPKDDPFSTAKEDPFSAKASTPPKEDPFVTPAPSKDDPFTALTTPPKEDPFSASKDDTFTAPTTPPKEDPFAAPLSPPKDDASDPFSAPPASPPHGDTDAWGAPATSPPAKGLDPWGDGPSATSPVDNGDPFGDASMPDNDPWGAPAPAPANTDDAWGSPAPPTDSSPSSDPFGDGASKGSDPWGAPNNAPNNSTGKRTAKEEETYRKTASFLGSAGASLVDLDDLFSSNPKPQPRPLIHTSAAHIQAIGTLNARGITSGPMSQSLPASRSSALPGGHFGSILTPPYGAPSPAFGPTSLSRETSLFQLQSPFIEGCSMRPAVPIMSMMQPISAGANPQTGFNMNPASGGVPKMQSGSLFGIPSTNPYNIVGSAVHQSGAAPSMGGGVPMQPLLLSGSTSEMSETDKNSNPFLF